MKYLYLLRHSKSEWDTPFDTDKERGLSARGMKNASALRKYLYSREIQIDAAYISDAKRTKETFSRVNKNLDIIKEHIFVPELYDSNFDTYFEWILKTPDTFQSLLILGHNPEMEIVANRFLGNWNTDSLFHKFPTSAFCCISFDIHSWLDLKLDSKGKLVLFYLPGKGEKE